MLIEVGSTNANQYRLCTKHRSNESNALATYPPIDALESDPMMTPPLYVTARMVVCGREQRNLFIFIYTQTNIHYDTIL